MKRRAFLKTATAVAALPLSCDWSIADDEGGTRRVMTVEGEVSADRLGKMLPHEHVMVDFVGADKVSPQRYEADEVFRVMLPYVNRVKEAGCRTIAECTPAYLGRDPKLLQRLSKATGVKFLTNTGYYGAKQGKFLPAFAFRESADELSKRWTAEWKVGIEGTGIRPGFIKIGVDAGELTAVNRKLIEAAARCHLDTGLVIAGHTGDGRAALEQVEVLKRAGVSPAAWVWVHAQNERNTDLHLQAARAGAWVEFDGVGPTSIERHVELTKRMRDAGLLDHVLLSHDAGWYSVGEPRGGKVRRFDTLFTTFLTALDRAGFSEDNIKQLIVTNPANALAIGVRSA
jgi:predicted metal-dependent phosphotriesterase family hydrolase